MSAFHDNALLGASGQQGYKISRSVRLRSSASAYLNRTFGSGSRTTWTWNCWVKRGAVGVVYPTTNYAQALFGLNDSDKIYFYEDALWVYLGTGATYVAQPSDKFRDPSAWYHIVVVLDTTNATSGDRVRIYVNNRRVTISQTMPTQNWASSNFNSAINHNIGKADNSNLYYLDAYLTEIHFIDGQALTPSSFGETDTLTGVWKPKKYAGTYGTNGFYLNFSDNSAATATTIGKDYSGNGNNWTPNNISVTAGVTYDSMIDSPTVGATSSNYAVLNPLAFNPTYISDGNLLFAGANLTSVRGSFQIPSTGMWYWELTPTTTMPNYVSIGLAEKSTTGSANFGSANTWGLYPTTTLYTWSGTSGTNTGISTPALGCTFALAFDASTGKLWLGYAASGAGSITWIGGGSPASGTSPTYTLSTTLELFPFVCSNNTTSDKSAINFGQRPFSYTPPTGFVALNTQNLPAPTISNGAQYMAASTYTGTGATQSIVNSGNNAAGISFQPDFVWIKDRSAARSHRLFDAVRGATKALFSDATDAETTLATDLTAFNSNGFTLGAGAGSNSNTETFVGWQWKASGSTVSNTSGSITSTVSAGATQGFSVVTFTGNYNGSTGTGTVGHGLGVAPKMIIIKNRSQAFDWGVGHASIGWTQAGNLNLTNAFGSSAYFNNTAPTSSVFSVGLSNISNQNGSSIVAYCFAEVAGYSAFGSYTGNGSADGPFVYCGFRPRFILLKSSSAANSWAMYDTSRSTSNTSTARLYANSSAAETTGLQIDVLSNGFKWREAGGQGNDSGATYIFAAFAENPFKLSLAR